ncbi:MAG: glutamate--cysteine ligase [Pseudomonadota bacterium]|nr:glutamate--cysteine ligase [Pseudomonadota bacterium]
MVLNKKMLQWLEEPNNKKALSGIARGIEREGLRVTEKGLISQKKHPEYFGSALCHDSITTDYSEALLEIITTPHNTIEECLTELNTLHSYIHSGLEDELIWPFSMPPQLFSEEDIPIAEYGNSLVGRMKRVYRKGLGLRYGRKMQSIAGIHYNISFPDEFWTSFGKTFFPEKNLRQIKDDAYFGLVRQFLRQGWMLTLMTGGSPICHSSFTSQDIAHEKKLTKARDTYIGHTSSSLRMGGIGYHNAAQSSLFVCYDSIDHYTYTLSQALQIPSPLYTKYGLTNDEGRRHQLSTNVLQIENEFYGSIRPKQIAKSMERPTLALQERGVAYIEVRNIDIDPFTPSGISEETAAIIEIFVLSCLLSDSDFLTRSENTFISSRNEQVAMAGRDPEQQYIQQTQEYWSQLKPLAEFLASAYDNELYIKAYKNALTALHNPGELRSAKVLDAFNELEITTESETPYKDLAMKLAHQHHQYYLDKSLTEAELEHYEKAAEESFTAFQSMPEAQESELSGQIKTYLQNMPEFPQAECTALS